MQGSAMSVGHSGRPSPSTLSDRFQPVTTSPTNHKRFQRFSKKGRFFSDQHSSTARSRTSEPHSSQILSNLSHAATCRPQAAADTLPCRSDQDLLLSCTTFNILAPIYKRLGGESVRESQFKDSWLPRNQQILQELVEKKSSVICLQEFWLKNEELVQLYEDTLGREGYKLFKLGRTNDRGDGLLMAVRLDRLQVMDYREVLFHDCGDRVAQLLRVRALPSAEGEESAAGEEGASAPPLDMLVVNTHLLFPHNANSTLIRLRQVYKVLEYLEQYKLESNLPAVPIILCGDLNGSKKGQVFKFLKSQGFVSTYDTAHEHHDGDVQWVSHRNHHGSVVGVDYIWLLNPCAQTQPLTADWKAAVFGMIKAKLSEAGLQEERVAFDFFRSSDSQEDCITLHGFQYAMDQLGLTGEETVGLTQTEIEELLKSVDLDGNGVIDYSEFQRVLNYASMEEAYACIREATGIVESPWSPSRDGLPPVGSPAPLGDDSPSNSAPAVPPSSSLVFAATSSIATAAESLNAVVSKSAASLRSMASSQTVGNAVRKVTAIARDAIAGREPEDGRLQINLAVQDASLYPPEMAEGVWPDSYSLSDHALLTAVFTPVRA